MENWNNDDMCALRDKIAKEGLSGNIEKRLNELNKKFMVFQNDWLSKSEEEQQEQSEWYFWANRYYYQIGEKYTEYLLNLETMEVEQPESEKGLEQVPYQNYQQTMKPIIELEQLYSVTDEDINKIINAIQFTMTEAKKINLDPAQCTNTIIALVSAKLDELSKGIWEFQMGTEEPTLDMLIEFLMKRIRHIRNNETASASKEPSPSTSKEQSPSTPKGRKLCIYCGSTTHTIFKCIIFGGLKLEKKEHFILVKEKRCINCFQNTHAVNECYGGNCGRCQIKHNSLMCRRNPNNH